MNMRFALPALLFAFTAATAAQQTTMTIEALGERILTTETALIERMRASKPILEVYAQHVEPHARLGTVPVRDDYFLGQFAWSPEGPTIKRLTPEKGRGQQISEWLWRPFSPQLRANAFAAMGVPDWRSLDPKRYEFKFLRREFLGEVRCLVLELAPRGDSRDGFTGRIWVEERDFNIVRFNGITRGLPGSPLETKKDWYNVDSWRVNVQPELWLPAYVYAEQQSSDPKAGPSIKSHVRLWGYDPKSSRATQELTTITIDAPSVLDSTKPAQQLSPTLSQRMWEQQAEENVLERLTQAGLLAPPGEVDKVLETVVTNLQITNNLTIEPVKARVLLTSPLDSFTVGRTIVMSRGLIDVLPDEASLATMLSHELAHITLGHRVIDPQFAFADKLMVPDDELLATVAYRHSLKEESDADAKMVDLLKNSPYKDKLADAGLFLRAVSENAKKLKNLIQPHISEHTSKRLNELIKNSPTLAPDSVDQVAALPLGARVVVEPWRGQVELLRAANVPLTSAREKASLAVTPLVPYLRYAEPRP